VSTIALSCHERAALIDAAKAEVVRSLLAENRDDLSLLSPSQAAGILDVNINTLGTLGIPRIELAPKMIRYRVADIRKFLSQKTTK
jgi:hypothetical protein